ncbi:hypothetical protein [Thermomonospora catenispora]|uniref:hypothetical protein n=1 Tax=Thermomonospora catenispora TaxID=2493090 RepID=UPI001123B4D4|nr:hypothetical protein [Thermomonospora catenispora]TNY38261.1 hypothetical protein EIO00_04435 [Thermomonospora catenispora]
MSLPEKPTPEEPPAQRPRNVLAWALIVPTAALLGAALAQYPSVLASYGGILLALGAWAAAAAVTGGIWGRTWPTLLMSLSLLALLLFGGPAYAELYMKRLGEPAPAVVVDIRDRSREGGRPVDGDGDLVCTVMELNDERTVHRVSQQENCWDQFTAGQRITIRKDPLGLLEPRLPDGPDQGGTLALTVAVAAGAYLLTAAAIVHAGRRR